MRISFLKVWEWACVIGFVAGNVMAGVETAPAASHESHELSRRIKAGFLFTFVKYVDWAPDAFVATSNAVVIGVLGKDPFGPVLETVVEGKKFNDHPVRIERFQRVEDIGACHVLYVSESEKAHLRETLKALRGRKILTVGEMEGFLQKGGQIQLVMEENRLRFDINLGATKEAGLSLSSHLLRVARYLIRPGDDEEERSK